MKGFKRRRGLEIRVSRRTFGAPGKSSTNYASRNGTTAAGPKGRAADNAASSIRLFTEGSQAGVARYRRLTKKEKRSPMKSTPLAFALILALAGCAEFQQQSALSSGISPSEVEWARKTGRNTVSGNASLTSAGTTHTCAGQSANLIPDTAYARARMTAIFGNASRGTRAASLGPVKFERDDPLYVQTLRTTRCDSSGSFSFPGVPDGSWYATTSVKWQGTSQVEGSSMMRRVDVQGGRLVKVMLP
jgi:hypothetical protein